MQTCNPPIIHNANWHRIRLILITVYRTSVVGNAGNVALVKADPSIIIQLLCIERDPSAVGFAAI